jgi:hypothetical protein
MKTFLSRFTASLFFVGCAGSAASDPAPGATGALSQAQQADAPPADLSGTWGFVLASSDVAAGVRKRCDETGAGDPAKAKACWADIANQAAKEKIRFGQDGGKTVWTSFETDGKNETVYVQVPVELAADGPGRVLAKVAGVAKGQMAEQFKVSSTNAMHIEIVDGRTIAMNDPRKGRLVYVKE